jgi:hypothetical protein
MSNIALDARKLDTISRITVISATKLDTDMKIIAFIVTNFTMTQSIVVRRVEAKVTILTRKRHKKMWLMFVVFKKLCVKFGSFREQFDAIV